MNKRLLDLITQEMCPALGVTEPAAIALCAATARKAVGGEVQRLQLLLDPSVFKNGYSCRIPGTTEQGNLLAALLGAVTDTPGSGLRVLENITEREVLQAKTLHSAGAASVSVKEGWQEIWIEAEVKTTHGVGRARIQRFHDNITSITANGLVLLQVGEKFHPAGSDNPILMDGMSYTLHDVFTFAETVDAKAIACVLEAVRLNEGLLEAGRDGAGLGVGAALAAMAHDGTLANDPVLAAQTALAMAIDARMGGESKPAMTICGSGDHGIICTVPLAALARSLHATEDSLARAIAISYLITIFIKTFSGRLSAFCGCAVAAGTGMAAGAAYLMGAKEPQLVGTINNMAANLTGMICDGGNLGCTLKAVTAVGAGMMSARLALHGVCIPPQSGVVGATVEDTMRNMGYIATPGMLQTNDAIIAIMRKGE